MKRILLPTLCLLLLLQFEAAYSQGCVAIRQFSTGSGTSGSAILQEGEWQISSNYRYFKSFRHFRGDEEQPERITAGTEVINYSHALDLTLSYAFNNRLYANVTLPFVYNERSSLYEHGRTERHESYSKGLADMRIGAGLWLFSPEKYQNGNVALGLGIKLPTGDYAATDEFYNVGENGATQVRPVDQSIQPGDGGVGIALDLQAFQTIATGLAVYANAFYLINPRETNGTRTFRETLNATLANESIMSVPDQYAARLGLSYATPLNGMGVSLGGRIEGVPVEDLIGGSQGFRRPGYALSVEPGISYLKNQWALNLNVPVAVYRNRQQSVTDKEVISPTGEARHGDAAFADYLISVGIAFRFGGHNGMASPAPKWNDVTN